MERFVRPLLYILIGIGIVLRILSVGWNVIPHGDITLDAKAAQAMYTHGNFQLSEDITRSQADQYLIQHPPVWALLGAGAMHLLHVDSFTALRLLSFLCGILILPLMYIISKKYLSKDTALLLTTLVGTSWLMIDFSGNGALYSLHTLLFLVWIYAVLHVKKYAPLVLGIVCSVAYLTNYQTIVLIPATVMMFLMHRTQMTKNIMLYLCVFFTCISPWLIRNHMLFGEAFFGHTINSGYLYIKAGVDTTDYIYTAEETLKVLTLIFTRWLPFNMYFVARKLFILVPVLFIPFAYSFSEYPFSWKHLRKVAPVLILFLGHLAISTAWPVSKFRYFVPLFPLVLILGAYAVEHMHIRSRFQIKHILGASLVCNIAFSAITYFQIPTHTYYYDGAITQDAFHGQGEIEYMIDQGIL